MALGYVSKFSYMINLWGNISKYYLVCVNVQHIRICVSL